LDCPLSGSRLVLIVVALVLRSDVIFLRIVGVWRLDDREHSLDNEVCAQSWNPLLLNSLSADFATGSLDVGMVDFSDELYLGSLEWIRVVEVKIDNKFSTKERGRFGSIDDQVPTPQVVINKLDRNTCDGSGL